ncbi:MAG: G1 family glutamic endopeptidase, partial [Acidimicrobiales bacterium]
SWHVPQVQVPTKKRQLKKSVYSSTWVGIDGFKNGSLIQAGTEQDLVRGRALYQAWWEVFPAPETPISSMTIHAGDGISVSITSGVPNWSIRVTDTTTGQSFSSSHAYHGPGTSAEWIQEAPTVGRRVATLAVDSLAVFDHGTVDGASPGLVSSESGAMFKGRRQISTPSAPDTDADGFAVAYGSSAPSPPGS